MPVQALVDDWEFREEPFLEFVGASLQTLAEQLQSCEDWDAQLKVGSCLPGILPRCTDGARATLCCLQLMEMRQMNVCQKCLSCSSPAR